jgi:hypothetical protein
VHEALETVFANPGEYLELVHARFCLALECSEPSNPRTIEPTDLRTFPIAAVQ